MPVKNNTEIFSSINVTLTNAIELKTRKMSSIDTNLEKKIIERAIYVLIGTIVVSPTVLIFTTPIAIIGTIVPIGLSIISFSAVAVAGISYVLKKRKEAQRKAIENEMKQLTDCQNNVKEPLFQQMLSDLEFCDSEDIKQILKIDGHFKAYTKIINDEIELQNRKEVWAKELEDMRNSNLQA